MNYIKPTKDWQPLNVLNVKRGWRRWDDSTGRYRMCQKDEEGAREFFALTCFVPGTGEALLEVDARAFASIPLPKSGDWIKVRRNEKKVEVKADAEQAPSMTSEARELAQGNAGEVEKYLNEIVAIATLALSELEARK